MSMLSGPAQPALPAMPSAPPPPPVFAQAPQGQKPGKKPATPSYLNSSAVPGNDNAGAGKQLVGQ